MMSLIVLQDRALLLTRLATGDLTAGEMAEALEYHLTHRPTQKATSKQIKRIKHLTDERNRYRSLAIGLQVEVNQLRILQEQTQWQREILASIAEEVLCDPCPMIPVPRDTLLRLAGRTTPKADEAPSEECTCIPSAGRHAPTCPARGAQ